MRIGIVGCAGRMGRTLVREVLAAEGCELAGAIERAGSEGIGQDAGLLSGAGPAGVAVTDDPLPLFASADAVIDFTTPEATAVYARLAAQGKVPYVVGTTGLDPEQEQAVAAAARHCPLVMAPNMSLGVNLLLAVAEQVARALDDSYDIEVLEMHHRRKVDAPSGTALALGHAVAAGRGVDLAENAVQARVGTTGPRAEGAIGFAVLRGGDVAGEHTVLFAGPGERIELTHRASGREVFARGAVRAARWAADKPPGLYSMKDVLGLGA